MNASTDGGLIGHDPGDKSPRPCNRKEPAIIASELLTSERTLRHVRNTQRNNLAGHVTMTREVWSGPPERQASKSHQMRRRF